MHTSNWATTTCSIDAVALTLGLAGCEAAQENKRTTGALIGAGTGAFAGSAIAGKGNKTEGAAIGTAAGAGGGWLIGDQVDKQEDKDRDSARQASERRREVDDDYYYRRDSEYRRYD